MNQKEMAEKLYKDAYNRWCYEISHEKNLLTAKDIAHYMCDLVIQVLNPEHWGIEANIAIDEIIYWREVKEEIKKL